MSSSPQLSPPPSDTALEAVDPLPWKDEITECLAAHRARRGLSTSAPRPRHDPQQGLFTPPQPEANRVARVAAVIAERFAHQPTYRDLLAQERAERQRALEVAEAEEAVARAAASQAKARPQEVLPPTAAADPSPDIGRRRYSETSHRVVLHAPMPTPLPHQPPSRATGHQPANEFSAKELTAGPSEDTLTRAAAIEEMLNSILVEPTVPIPAKLLEFPRELVATRKARPRIAEGPLQDPTAISLADPASQLRIFEVEDQAISRAATPPSPPVADAPVWFSIRLDDPLSRRWHTDTYTPSPFALPLQPAPLSRRAWAGALDIACVAAAFLAFATVFFFSTTHPPLTSLGAQFAVGIFFLLCVLYQWIFFTYAESTPGMRAARIAFCTFDDTNPTRSAIRLRMFAVLLAACPLGLGFLWTLIDEDGLGWHDRIARMYQRSY